MCIVTLPIAASEDAIRAAELAEYAAETTGNFWQVHEALMDREPEFSAGDFEQIALESNLPSGTGQETAVAAAQERVGEDVESARRSGARAAVLGTIILYPRRDEESEREVAEETDAVCSAI